MLRIGLKCFSCKLGWWKYYATHVECARLWAHFAYLAWNWNVYQHDLSQNFGCTCGDLADDLRRRWGHRTSWHMLRTGDTSLNPNPGSEPMTIHRKKTRRFAVIATLAEVFTKNIQKETSFINAKHLKRQKTNAHTYSVLLCTSWNLGKSACLRSWRSARLCSSSCEDAEGPHTEVHFWWSTQQEREEKWVEEKKRE